MRATRIVTATLLAGGLALPLSWGAPVLADPKVNTALLTCGSTTYTIAVNGNGPFTPAHDVNSTRMFIPHAFGESTFTIRDATGAVVDSGTDPAIVQGSGKQKGDLSCNYSVHEVSDGSDPNFPAGYTFDVVGTVIGHATP